MRDMGATGRINLFIASALPQRHRVGIGQFLKLMMSEAPVPQQDILIYIQMNVSL